ncbi:uncharacterized protein KIAA0825-like [Saccostrea cucullata]|uniref:uncharacterized protein KIAA0825-like n=1 Tax=Saccostrea cuccullata TaxID=36930 RepID=UPI002ED0F6FF
MDRLYKQSSKSHQKEMEMLKTMTVPPVRSLLESVPPSQAVLTAYIDDLDNHLEENSRKMDECLHDILRTCNNLPGNKQFASPKEAINNVISTHIIEKDSCYDPEAEDVLTILSHVISVLENHPGSEEKLLQDLLSLSSNEGLSLPCKSHQGSNPMQSVTSVNAVSDNLELQIAQQWDQISLHLRRYFTDKLQKLPIDSTKPDLDLFEGKRIEYIHSLLALFSSDDILIKYQTLRSQQLERCFETLLPEIDSEQYSSMEITKNCRELSDIILNMIDEDFVIFNSGIFKKAFNTARAMHDMYLEKFSDEMSALVEDIWEDIEDIVNKPRKNSKDQLTSNQSHNAAQDVPDESNASDPSLPRVYMESILDVVTSVLHIEEHVEILLRCAAWDPAGVSSKRVKRKGSLRGVLKTSSSPEMQRRPLSYTSDDLSFSESFNTSFGSMPSSLSDSTPAPKVVERTRGEERLRWEWKLMFKKIAPDLSKFMGQQIRNLLKTTLDSELRDWGQVGVLHTEPVPQELWGGKLDYPKCISKSVSDFMTELDFLLPFARAGTDGSILNCVRVAYVDAINLCLQNFHVHLTKLCSDIPRNAPMQSLYILLASSVYIKNHLQHYEAVLTGEETSKKLFSALHKNYMELVDSLFKLTVEIHNNYMATSVLQDMESYNWKDNKEFQEGERCSFPVQMWNYHMRGLRHDLWTICPPRLSQDLFGQVLQNSIQILSQRYSQSKPSYRRTSQFRSDIITILLCASELLFPACNSVSMYLDPGSSQLPHYSIHNFCSTLLADMAIVASPLEILYKIYKRGFHELPEQPLSGLSSPTAKVMGSNTNWLSWIQPTIFQAGHKHYFDMRTTTALYFHCKLLLSQPQIDWAKVLQAFIMKDFTLPILFLTQSVTTDSSSKGNTDNSLDHEKVGETFSVITKVLTQCPHFKESVAKVLVPVINRCNEWKLLDTKTQIGLESAVPVWMETVFTLLDPFIHSILKPLLVSVVLDSNTGPPIRPIMSVLADLPCGCRPQFSAPYKSKTSESEKEAMDALLRQVVGYMSDNVYSIPNTVCIILRALQEHCIANNIKTPHHCAGLKILGTCLRRRLQDKGYLERITGLTLNHKQVEDLKSLADCIYYVLINTKAKSNATPKLGGKFCKENKEWVHSKIQSITAYLNNVIFEISDHTILEGATNEYMKQLFTLAASNILDSPTGQADLTCLYGLIANNFAWLEKQFDIQFVLPPYGTEDVPQFSLRMEVDHPREFDACKEYEMIGSRKFDHATVENYDINWQDLLSSDLGISEFGFRSLLYNRHEMQDGAYLEEQEKKPVETLKSVYENEPRELG